MLVAILWWIVSAVCLFPAAAGGWWLLRGRGGGKWQDHLTAILVIIGGICLVQAIRRTF